MTDVVYYTAGTGKTRHMRYVGRRLGQRGPLRGEGALVRDMPDQSDMVAVQFDSWETGKSHGWWPFRRREFA